MLRQRFLTSLWAMALLLLAIYLGQPWFTFFMALMTLAAAWEFYRFRPSPRPLAALALVLSPFFSLVQLWQGGWSWALGVGYLLGGVLGLLWSRRASPPGRGGLWEAYIILYLALLLGSWVTIRNWAGGREWVLLGFLATFACDTAAYFVGRAWGRRRLAPHISPGKTWEGAAGGFVGAVLAAVVLVWLLHLPLTLGPALLLGAGVGKVAQLGDLAESWLKRSYGVKDAGGILPGHGGVLDRIDSIAFTGPLVYYLGTWLQ